MAEEKKQAELVEQERVERAAEEERGLVTNAERGRLKLEAANKIKAAIALSPGGRV